MNLTHIDSTGLAGQRVAAVPALGLQTYSDGFSMWVLGNPTRVLMLVWQALGQQNHPSLISGFYDSICHYLGKERANLFFSRSSSQPCEDAVIISDRQGN